MDEEGIKTTLFAFGVHIVIFADQRMRAERRTETLAGNAIVLYGYIRYRG